MHPSHSHPVAAPMLHLLCGKIGAGKSTLAARLAASPATVRVSEDDWLAAVFPGEIQTLADYARCSARLRAAMAPHVAELLRAGVSVVLDFPSNTPATRAWARGVAAQGGATAQLHWLDLPDAVCLARLRARNAAGEHPFQTSDEEYARISAHFVPPTEAEGLRIVRHPAD